MSKVYKEVKELWVPTHEDYVKAEKHKDPLMYPDLDLFEGKASDVIERIKAYKKYSGSDVEFRINYGGYSDVDLEVYTTRLETDKERDARLDRAKKQRERAKKAKEKREAQDRKLYERLKEKFE